MLSFSLVQHGAAELAVVQIGKPLIMTREICILPPVPNTLSSSKLDMSTRPLPVRFTVTDKHKQLVIDSIVFNSFKFRRMLESRRR